MLEDHEVVALILLWNKMQSVGVGTKPDSDSGVRQASRYRSRDLEMAADFELIACDAIALDADLAQRMVKNRSRSGAVFAIHDLEAGSPEVGETADGERIPGRRREPKFPSRKVHDDRTALAQCAAD